MYSNALKIYHGSLMGFTLLEFLLANFLGSLIILMSLNFYAHCLRFQFNIAQFVDQLESARYASFYLHDQFSRALVVKGLAKNDPRYVQFKIKNSTQAVDVLTRGRNYTLFISENRGVKLSKIPLFSLYMKEGNNPRVEIVHGVMGMEILYGIKCANSSNICGYASAESVGDWGQVKSVKIMLLIGECLLKNWRIYIALRPSFQ